MKDQYKKSNTKKIIHFLYFTKDCLWLSYNYFKADLIQLSQALQALNIQKKL